MAKVRQTDRRCCPFAGEKRTNGQIDKLTERRTASKWRRQYVAGRWNMGDASIPTQRYPRLSIKVPSTLAWFLNTEQKK